MQDIQVIPEKLKVLLLESGPNWGGQEERIVREAIWLEKRGHKVILACNKDAAIAGKAAAAGIEIRSVPMRSNADLRGLWELAKLVRREKPHLIHAHSPKDAWFAMFFHMAGVPVVRSRHTTLPDRMSWGRKFVYRRGCRRLIASARFIAEAMRRSLGVPAGNIDVIGESVDTSEFRPGDGSDFRREFGINESAPLFGIVAMLRGEKGHDVLLRAARMVLEKRPDARFAIVGKPASSGRAHRRILEIIETEFTGFAEPPVVLTGFRSDIPNVMRALDCLVVPSRHEAQTLVIPQAFAAGKPVIGSSVGGIPELVRHGENGFLFPSQDHNALAEAMLDIANDPAKSASLGRVGRRLAEEELAVDRKMELLLASYRRCIVGT